MALPNLEEPFQSQSVGVCSSHSLAGADAASSSNNNNSNNDDDDSNKWAEQLTDESSLKQLARRSQYLHAKGLLLILATVCRYPAAGEWLEGRQ